MLRRLRLLVVLLAAVTAFTACVGGSSRGPAASAGSGSGSGAGPEAVIYAYNERSKEKDLEGMADLFTYPAVFSAAVPGLEENLEQTIANRDELIAYFRDEVFAYIGTIYDMQVTILDTQIAGDTAIIEVEASQDVENLALARRATALVRNVVQLKRIGGQWYISHLHTQELRPVDA